MNKATLTLKKLEDAVKVYQGAIFRGHLKKTMADLKDAYNPTEEYFRTHLGASIIGRECPREIWYGFRWVTKKAHTGRILRLFNRGHLEEGRFVAMLLAAGMEVWQQDQNGNQFRISDTAGHFGGSLDSVVRGIPELPEAPVLAEYKTHGDKSFAKLTQGGVMSAKWEHFVQMQIYMGKMALETAIYLAVNKNDDEIHAELIRFDNSVFQRYLERARSIIFSLTPPKRVNESPSWFICKVCDHAQVCHASILPHRSCRSCDFSRPVDDGKNAGTWWCDSRQKAISKEDQLAACENYELIQGL